MSESETILFDYGTEGGGAIVYQLHDNTVIERGSSGGITGDENDPIKKCQRVFSSFEDWWQNFTDKHKDFWIMFSPQFIHVDIKPLIESAIKKYDYPSIDTTRHKQRWTDRM